MKKLLIIGLVAAFVLIVLAVFTADQTDTASLTTTNTTNSVTTNDTIEVETNTETTAEVTTESETMTEISGGYTLADVANHNSATDCWLVIDDTIYDLTDYIATGFHKPGMEYVINECGTDASALFAKEHTGRHASEADAELAEQPVIGKLQ